MMKRIYILLGLMIAGMLFPTVLSGQSSNQNYVRTRTMTNDAGSVYLDHIQYFDGLGRPVQKVQKQITPGQKDLVVMQEFDAFNRESNSWLPAAIAGNNGNFAAASTVQANAKTTNANDQRPYAYPEYEVSPLNRAVKQYGPGTAWNNAPVKTDYLTNTSSYVCAKFSAIYRRAEVSITRSGNYANGELYVTRMTDENGNISYEFKDKIGQVLLTRQMNGATPHDTYYVYDDFNNLRAVIPPIAADLFTSGTWTETTENFNKYVFAYKYDDGNRCIAKKLPGAEWTYYVYDYADRLIFTQDGEARAKGEWVFTIPDAFGRIVLTGTCKNTFNYAASRPLGTNVVKATWANTNNVYKGYTVSGITLTAPAVLTAQYYDTYDFLALSGFTSLGYVTPESGFGTRHTASSKSLLTGTYVAEANGGGEQLCTALYYDYRGRLIQSQTTNHLFGIDSEFIGYNFSGQPLKTKIRHTALGKTTQIEYYTYTYDHAGRMTKTEHQEGSSTATRTVLAENTYDDLGRLNSQKKGSLPITYFGYNVRSWMRSISGTLFSQTIHYNDSYGGNTPQYNGNISAMSWRVGTETSRGYRFAYDGLSRMTKADYLLNGAVNDNYKVPSISYDKHGNITALQRWGKTASGYGIVDNLTLGYIGNQLNYVTDAAVKTPDVTAGLNDFKDASSLTSGEYAFNRNGAITKDLNKGISNIAYNSLNLPTQLTINGVTNNYKYAADGTKLSVTRGSDITDYVGNKIYENGSLKRILVDGGYWESGEYHFYIQDHQGNNRVVVKGLGNGTVVQTNHYYPFGMTFGEVAASEQDKQAYKYNGKELDRKNGLNLYDYSARYMEPALGRFTTMDPLAEKYYSMSPYAYCANNPVRFVDPDGMQPEEYNTTFWQRIGQAFNNLFSIKVDTSSEKAKVQTIERHSQQLETIETITDGIETFNAGASLIMPASSAVELGAAIYAGAGTEAIVGATASVALDVATGGKGKAVKTGAKAVKKTITEQAVELVKKNNGKNSITLRTPNKQIRYDLQGATHGNIPTPHKQTYKKNFVNGVQKSITREGKEATSMTQQEIRMVRKYLNKK